MGHEANTFSSVVQSNNTHNRVWFIFELAAGPPKGSVQAVLSHSASLMREVTGLCLTS